MFKSLLGDYGPSAKLSGSTLVLSLPDALTPVVWTLDLLKDGHGALSIHEDTETKEYQLVFAGSKKNAPVVEVGRYRERSRAVRALVKATEALENTDGLAFHGEASAHAMPAAVPHAHPAYAPQRKSGAKSFIISVLGIAFIVFLFLYGAGGVSGLMRTPLGWMLMSGGDTVQTTAPQQAQRPVRDNPAPDAVGVPMDADSFFGTQ